MRTEPAIEGVLPLTLRDVERAQILLDSLEEFFPGLNRLHVVVPGVQRAAIESSLRFARLVVHDEIDIVPELPFWRALFKSTIAFRKRPDGWYVQQLVKMAGPRYVSSAHYLTFDADVICARPVRPSDLIRDGRALCQRFRDEKADWYNWATRVLGRGRTSELAHGATPLLYASEAMGRLHAYLETRQSTLARLMGNALGVARHWNSWVGVLMRSFPWAEHTLYHVFLESEGLYERYHVDQDQAGARALHDRSVWFPGEFERWDASAAFAEDGPYFCVVQSWLGIPPAEVRRKLAAAHVAFAG